MATKEQSEELARQAEFALRNARIMGKEVEAQVTTLPDGRVVMISVYNNKQQEEKKSNS